MDRLSGRILLYCPILIVISTTFLFADQPSKAKDLTAFARPKSLCTFNTNDPHGTLQKILDIISAQGFKSDGIDWSMGEINASRRDSGNSPDQDKLLIWLERDFEQPQTKVRLYLIYGRFEQWFGTNGDLVRVKADEYYEGVRIGKLKQNLIDLASKPSMQ